MEHVVAAASSSVPQPQPVARTAQSVQSLSAVGNISRKPSPLPTFVAFQEALRGVMVSLGTAIITYPEDAEHSSFRTATEQNFTDIGSALDTFMTAADQTQLQLDKQSQHQLHSSILGMTSDSKLDETVALPKLRAEVRETQELQALLTDFTAYLLDSATDDPDP